MDKRWNKLFTLKGKSDLNFIKEELEVLGFVKNFKIINVVGTNGKGSTSTMISNALQDEGYKVGIFTSPHLVLPNERISINGDDITDKDFFGIFRKTNPKQFFSSLFIVAMKYFSINNVDFAIIEAGVGGKKDSTNAVDGDFGLLTSIGLDHIEYLGDSHQKIFDDKICIKNEGMKFFIPSYLPKDIVIPNDLDIIDNYSSDYQSRNIKLVEKFMDINFNLKLKNLKLPRARTELKKYKGVNCIFDVSHNVDGIKATLEFLELNNVDFDEVVISLAKHKEDNGVLDLFGKKKIRFYKPDDSFREFNLEEIQDINKFTPEARTLFIGSFRLIGALYE